MKKIYLLSLLFAVALLPAPAAMSQADIMPSSPQRVASVLNDDGLVMPVVWCARRGEGSVRVAFYSVRYLGENASSQRTVKLWFDNRPMVVAEARYLDHIAVLQTTSRKDEVAILEYMRSAHHVNIQLEGERLELISDQFSLERARSEISDAARQCDDLTWRLRGPIPQMP